MPNSRYKVFGITGYATSGKDTAAEVLIQEGWQPVSFADPIRQALLALDPLIPWPGFWNKLFLRRPQRLSRIIEEYGWDAAKSQWPEIRRLMQKMGTEVFRVIFGDQAVLDIAERKIKSYSGPSVIRDVRYQDEVDLVHRLGGVVARVVRPGVGPVNAHKSDALDFDVDFLLFNDDTKRRLWQQVMATVFET